MSNSKKLPIIKVGDTVVFRKDLEKRVLYGSLYFDDYVKNEMNNKNQTVEEIDLNDNTFITDFSSGCWFSFEMVAEVIKPTKERMYSEAELRSAIEMARVGNKSFWGYTANAIIESLNTEGK